MSKYDQTFRDLNRQQEPSTGAIIAGAVIGFAAFYALIVLTLSL
jgi:hypothetical protein